MITTTKSWKDALGCINIPYRDNLVPVNDIKIEYEQIDTEAQNSATVAVNSSTSFSDHSEVMNLSLDYGSESPLATLEPNEWVLDGTMENVGTSTHCGWVSSEMSLSDGSFTTNPKMTLTWDEEQTVAIPGLSVWWSQLLNEWATQFKVTAKLNGTTVSETTFNSDEVTDFYEGAIEGYDTVEIEIIKWCLPYRRARIENVCMGFTVYIAKSEVLSAEHSMSSDLLSFTLPDDYFTFEIDNVSEEWNPDNPTGRYAYLLERQRVTVKYAFKINGAYEWHTVGTYFMSEWTTPQNGISAEFTARSLIDFMTKKFVPSSISGYTYGDSITLKALAENAFTQAGLPTDADGSVKWSVASDLADISVEIPYSSGDNLLPLGNQTLTADSTDYYIYYSDVSYQCTAGVKYIVHASCDKPWGTHSGRVANTGTIWLTDGNSYHQVFEGDGVKSGVKSWEWTCPTTATYYFRLNTYQSGSVVTFSDIGMYAESDCSYDFDYSCAEVVQLVANAGCAVIRPNENGDICVKMPDQTVSDYYIDQFVAYSNGEYELSKALKTVNINNGELIYTPTGSVDSGEEQSISNCLLQSTSQRTAECAFVSDLLLKRKTIDGEFRADPRLQPLDVITNVNKYAANRVYISEVVWTYSGAFRGRYAGKVIKSIPLVNNIGEQYTGYAYSGEYGGE